MLETYITAIALMILISCLWLAVQRLWGRSFPEQRAADGDALQGRSGCHNCSCTKSRCENSTANTANREAS